MKIHDISMPIHYEMTVYKNKEEKRPLLRTVQDHVTASAYESRIDMEMHTGTHVDAPLHMIDGEIRLIILIFQKSSLLVKYWI